MIRQADGIIGATRSLTPSAYSAAIQKLKENHPDLKIGAPPTLSSWDDGAVWLRNQLNNQTQIDQIISEYNQLADETSKTEIKKLRDEAKEIKQSLSDAGFQLIPSTYLGWKDLLPWQRHFWGILASAALLSLGAPFWFNLLKSRSNLRPVLAEKVEKKPV